ncbi:MAG: hypothetical protein NVSMB57_09650 [Actinomycetota bacterium]
MRIRPHGSALSVIQTSGESANHVLVLLDSTVLIDCLRGITLAQADCLIAATALNAGASLATGNPKDFPMPDVRVDHWPVGR